MLRHSLTYFEIQRYYQNESRFIGVYLRDNLPKKIKDRAYLIDLDEYADVGTHWIALHALNNNDLFILIVLVLKTFLKRLSALLVYKNMQTNVFRIQAHHSAMCGYFCIAFIDYILVGKTLFDYTGLLSLHDLKKRILKKWRSIYLLHRLLVLLSRL